MSNVENPKPTELSTDNIPTAEELSELYWMCQPHGPNQNVLALDIFYLLRDVCKEVERRKIGELAYRFAAEKLLDGLMEMRTFLWDRDTRLMAQDGSCRDSHEGCEQALSHLWDIIDPLTNGKRKDDAKQGDKEETESLRAQVAELKAERDEMREDAEKWRALMSCERIRIMGRTMDYKHIGIEFWVKHRAAHPCEEFPQDECRGHFEEFVRRAQVIIEGKGDE